MKLNNRNIFIFFTIVLILCLLSFILGVYTLKDGTLRKAYDIFFAVKNLDLNNINYSSLPKIDTLDLKMSKKNKNKFIKIRSNKLDSLKNIMSNGVAWNEVRPWLNTKLILNNNTILDGEIKMIGINPDHFREAENWSCRVKLKKDQYLKGFKKFNLLNPYSRGYFNDVYYNTIFKEEGGLIINSQPVITRILNSFRLQIFEPFFSKELIESQQRRDGLILNDDSVDVNHIKHLRIVHPDKFTSLSSKQIEMYQFYDAEFRKGNLQRYINIKQYAFLVAVGINIGGEPHHLTHDNLYLYADPINGQLLPFLREVSTVAGENNGIYDYNTIKYGFYKLINLNANQIPNFVEFDYWVNNYSRFLNTLNINKIIEKNKNLLFQYYYTNKYFPWAYAYKKRLRVEIRFNKFENYLPTKSNNFIKFTGNKIIKDTSIIFTNNDSIVFSKETNIIVINSTIIFSGTVNTAKDFKRLNITGDSLSTIVFVNSNVNLSNSHFKGFGNKIKLKNRDVTAAITFSNSTLNLRKCTFEGNYSGDDLVNIFRSNFICDDIKLSNAKLDGLDLDFSKGTILNSNFLNCGNDGIDVGSSNVQIIKTNLAKCNDKAISIGEESNVQLDNININSNEIGIGLKDASSLSLKGIIANDNHLDLAAFSKKGIYGPSSIINIDSSFNQLHYLIEPNVYVPKSTKIKYTPDIIKYMYGKKYGKASVR